MDLSCSSHSFSTSSLLRSNSVWSLLSCLFNPSLPLTPPLSSPTFPFALPRCAAAPACPSPQSLHGVAMEKFMSILYAYLFLRV